LRNKEKKKMPMSGAFEERLFPKLPGIIKHFGTPFHIYDEQGIIDNAVNWKTLFKDEHCSRMSTASRNSTP